MPRKKVIPTRTKVYNLSGGKSSAMMTIECKPTEKDVVLFTDTEREHEKTYKFLDDIEKHEGFKIHRAIYTHEKSPGLSGFDALINYKKYVPNRTQRICTVELKIWTARRYLRSIGIQHIDNYIGFRADEPNRVKDYSNDYKKTVPFFPLYEQGINKAMVNAYWEAKPYNLEIPPILGNCTLCMLKGKDAIIKILAKHPELAEPWIKDEQSVKDRGYKKGKGTFIKGVTYKALLHAAQTQTRMFDLDEVEPAFNCACTQF